MTEGPLGGPRPLSKDYLSINMEFYGEPQGLSVGRHEDFARQVEQEMYRQSVDDPLPKVAHVQVYPPDLHIGSSLQGRDAEQGFEVEVEFTDSESGEDSDKLTLEQIQMVEKIFNQELQNEHHKTYVISI